MKPLSPVFAELARRYRRRHAGRTGRGNQAVVEELEPLLHAAGCADGDAREVAERELKAAEVAGVLQRIPYHPRDPEHIARIQLRPENESAFFRFLGIPSPAEERAALAAQLDAVRSAPVPERWQSGWLRFLERRREAALSGGPMDPLDREDSEFNHELLRLLPGLLAWQGESLLRFASCVLCGSSKRLEQLAGKLERLLGEITDGELTTLESLGIVANPRSALVHGPLRLRWQDDWLDLGRLSGAFRIAQPDLDRAEIVESTARRCLTVENETTFHELAKLQSGELLIQTSYPGSGVLALLRRLPESMEFHHFGDSDEAGFAILEDLRAKSGRDFRPLHMERGRIPFEQESLGRPSLSHWPFYSEVSHR